MYQNHTGGADGDGVSSAALWIHGHALVRTEGTRFGLGLLAGDRRGAGIRVCRQ